jgi:hypothetical protein
LLIAGGAKGEDAHVVGRIVQVVAGPVRAEVDAGWSSMASVAQNPNEDTPKCRACVIADR